MKRPNKVEKIDVADVPGLAEVLSVECSTLDYEGCPGRVATASFETPTHGALQITLATGDVIVIGTSEWCSVDYYRPQPLMEVQT